MRVTEHLFFYIEVIFGTSARRYSYICNDLSVKIGDTVEVPAGNNQQIKATVVSTMFCTADEAPYPVEKTKTVIGKAVSVENKISSPDSAENGLLPTTDNSRIMPSESIAAVDNGKPKDRLISQSGSITESPADNAEKQTASADSCNAFFTFLLWTFGVEINFIILYFGIAERFDYITKGIYIIKLELPVIFISILLSTAVTMLLHFKPKFITVNKNNNAKKIYVQGIISLIIIVLTFLSFTITCANINAKEEAEYKASHPGYSCKSKSKSKKTTAKVNNNNSPSVKMSSGKKSKSSDDEYNAGDYSHPDDFYYDYYDDFIDYEEAEDYRKEHHDD